MKTKIFGFTGIFLFLFVLGSFHFTSCRKKGETPVVPPIESFKMNTDALPDSTSGKTATDTTLVNWGHSVVTVVVWQTIVTLYMAVPVLAYAEAFNHTAAWDKKEKKWKWEYSVTGAFGIVYTAKLYGWVDGDNYNWKMYVSQSGGFQNFLWYEGITRKDQTHAEWTLYKSANEPVKFIGIDYNKNGDGTSNIKYTNIEAGGSGNSGYIAYGLTTDAQYNAYYDVYVMPQTHLTEIRWNTTSKVGKVRDSQKFSDSNWHCWDTMLRDAICP